MNDIITRAALPVSELKQDWPPEWETAAWNQIREEWRPLWGNYEISSEFKVRGRRGPLKLHPTAEGNNVVRLYRRGRVRNFRVAQLVAEAWRQPWGYFPYARGGSARLTENQVREIRRLGAAGVRRQVIADEFGISRGHAIRIIKRRRWRQLS